MRMEIANVVSEPRGIHVLDRAQDDLLSAAHLQIGEHVEDDSGVRRDGRVLNRVRASQTFGIGSRDHPFLGGLGCVLINVR